MKQQRIRLRILNNNCYQLIYENRTSIITRRDCFENAVILCRRILSFVAADTIRQANDIYSANATKLHLRSNVAKHWLCVKAH